MIHESFECGLPAILLPSDQATFERVIPSVIPAYQGQKAQAGASVAYSLESAPQEAGSFHAVRLEALLSDPRHGLTPLPATNRATFEERASRWLMPEPVALFVAAASGHTLENAGEPPQGYRFFAFEGMPPEARLEDAAHDLPVILRADFEHHAPGLLSREPVGAGRAAATAFDALPSAEEKLRRRLTFEGGVIPDTLAAYPAAGGGAAASRGFRIHPRTARISP